MNQKPTTIKNTLAQIFLGLSLSFLGSHIGKICDYQQTIFFAIFFIIFRVKWYFDDIKMYQNENSTTILFQISYFIGIFPWFLWILSPTYLPDIAMSLKIILIAFVLMTISCFADLNKTKWYITFNLIYMIIIGFNLKNKIPFSAAMTLLIFFCIIDICVHKSLKAIEK